MELTFFCGKIASDRIENAASMASNNNYLKDCNLFFDINFHDLSLEEFKLGLRSEVMDLKVTGDLSIDTSFVYLGKPKGTGDHIVNAAYRSFDMTKNLTICWSNKTNYFFEILYFDHEINTIYRIIPNNLALW